MLQERLFRLAVEAMHCQMTFVAGEGWHLSITSRRQDEQWPDAYRATYSYLSTSELVDIVEAEIAQQLGTA